MPNKPLALLVFFTLQALGQSLVAQPPTAPTTVCDFDPAQGPEMVMIPGGTFLMGAPDGEPGAANDEKPQHLVSIQPFAMGRCEVTQAEYQYFVSQTNYSGTRLDNDKECVEWPGNNSAPNGQQPVTCVSWYDAQAYILWLNQTTGQTYRLPSEAEWEYATRAGTTTPFSTGECIANEQASFGVILNDPYADCGPVATETSGITDVGHYASNPWGLFDVHGNMWEWAEDCWHNGYEAAPSDGSPWLAENNGNCERRVLRGGAWYGNPVYLRSADRSGFAATFRFFITGFRLARTLEKNEAN